MAAAGTTRRIVSRWSRSPKFFGDQIHVAVAKPAKPRTEQVAPKTTARPTEKERSTRSRPRFRGSSPPRAPNCFARARKPSSARRARPPAPPEQQGGQQDRRTRGGSARTRTGGHHRLAPKPPRNPHGVPGQAPRAGTRSPVHPTPRAGPDGVGWTGSGGGRKAGRRRAGASEIPPWRRRAPVRFARSGRRRAGGLPAVRSGGPGRLVGAERHGRQRPARRGFV